MKHLFFLTLNSLTKTCDFEDDWGTFTSGGNSLKGGVHPLVNELTRLKIIPDRDIPMGQLYTVLSMDYYFDWLKCCSIFTCELLIFFLHF